MSLDHILHRIDEDARAGATAIIDEARAEAARRVASRESRAREEAGVILAAAREEAERIRRQAGAGARLELSRQVLGRRRAWLARVTEEALGRLLTREADLHRTVLSKLLERHAGEGLTAVTFSGDPVGKAAAAAFRRSGITAAVAPPAAPPRGGVLVRRGPLLLDLSFPRLMEETAERHQAELQSILFGEQG